MNASVSTRCTYAIYDGLKSSKFEPVTQFRVAGFLR